MRFTPDTKLHSREHLLADDLSQILGEPKKFAAYLGIATLYAESDLRALARRVCEKENLPREAWGKYFFAALRGLPKKPGTKLKRRKKKKRMRMPDILPIVKEPNKNLRKKSLPVPTPQIPSPKIQALISRMKATLRATPDGVGLAAPQVGQSLRIFIVSEEAEEIDKAQHQGWKRHPADNPGIKNERPYETREWKYYVFINPAVKNTSRRKVDGPEGCLSVPGKFGEVPRHEKITIAAHDEQGKAFTRGASKFLARVMQHELDHLDGVLFTDKAQEIFEQKEK